MGSDCSRPSREYFELYHPSDTLRQCNPDRCWCRGRHHSSKWMYVEQGRDGGERYHDPSDYMPGLMMGGTWPGSWKKPRDWTTRDYDRLGEIMSEYYSRVRGRQGMPGPWMSPAQIMPWMAGMGGGGGGPGGGIMSPTAAMMMGIGGDNYFKFPREYQRSSSRRSGWEDEIMQRIKRMEEIAKDYEERVTGMSNHMYGSDAERQEEMYKRRQAKLWQEFQQAQMPGVGMMGVGGMAGMGMGGMGGMGMPQGNPMMAAQGMAGMVGMPAGYAGGAGMGPMGMAGGYGGVGGLGQMGGFGGMNGMNPYGMGGGAGSMMGPDPMAARLAQMQGMGGGLGDYGGGGGHGMGGGMGMSMGRRGGRRPRRSLNFSGEDEDDDDFAGGFGGSRRRRRRDRFDDDGGFFGGLGDGRRSPRDPPGGSRRPRPTGPNRGDGPYGGGGFGGGGLGGGGLAHDQDYSSDPPSMRSRFSEDIPLGRTATAQPAQPTPATAPIQVEPQTHGSVSNSPPPWPPSLRSRPPTAGLSTNEAPLSTGNIPMGPGAVPHTGPGAASSGDPYRSAWPYESENMNEDLSNYPSASTLNNEPARGGLRRPGTPANTGQHVRFEPEAPLTRPRTDQERRGENPTGATPDKRDMQ